MSKIRDFLKKLKEKKVLSFVLIVFLFLGLIISVYLVQQRQEIRNKAAEPQQLIKENGMNRKNDFSNIQPLDINTPIYSFKISGDVNFQYLDSFIRVVLIDQEKNEYLVYESYPLISENKTFSVSEACEETCLLDSITPVSLRIEGNSSSFKITNTSYAKSPEETDSKISNKTEIQDEQTRLIEEKDNLRIQKLNEEINKKGMKWVAGETSISQMNYQDKKKLFSSPNGTPLDHLPNLQGFEYYKGGIFEFSSTSSPNTSSSLLTASLYPATWDWRYRHGQNWMTPVRDQGNCNGCWAFAPVAAIEADTNLYINEHFNFNMSEQDLLSCSGAGDCERGGYPESALLFIQNNGIVDQSCFLNQGGGIPCQRCSNWQNLYYKIAGFGTFIPKNEDEIKNRIAEKGVLSGGIYSWNHVMGLLGWQTDVDNTTIWIFKNSWGATWGENGYGKIKVPLYDMFPPSFIDTPILVNGLTIPPSCRDADGDGYCFWGISDTKPATCSQSCAELPDCDDSDPSLQVFDQYYNCRPYDSSLTPPPSLPTTTPAPTLIPTLSPTLMPIPVAESSRVFITSTSYNNGNLGGLVGADAKCQARAGTAHLGGVWKAWLSDSNISASSRLIHGETPYKRIDGAVIADNWADLTDGSLQSVITIDETGNQKTTNMQTWTNTQIDGSKYYADYAKSCNDWTADIWGPSAIMGFASHTDGLWTIGFAPSTTNCQNIASLYCFEQTYPPTPTSTPTPTNTPTPTFTPTPTPIPPRITTTSLPIAPIYVKYTANIEAVDPKKDTLTMTITNLPSGITLSSTIYRSKSLTQSLIRRTITGTPLKKGDFNILINVKDQHGSSITKTIRLTVR